MNREIITSNQDLESLIKEGQFFTFCVAFALNKGFKDAIVERIKAEFSVGDYNVKFDPSDVSFTLTHKVYFARIIMAHFNGSVFMGDSEQEVISDLLIEFKKEAPELINQP